MKIVHIVNFFIPSIGYTEYYLARKQQEVGHEVYIITSNRFPYQSKTFETGQHLEEGIKTIRIQALFAYSGNVFVSFKTLRKTLIELSPEIVHIHGALSPMAFISLLYKDKLGYKVVADVITGRPLAKGASLVFKTAIFKIYKSMFLFSLLQRVDSFFANSEAAMDWINENLHIPKSKVWFVPLGADNELFRFDPQERRKIRKRLGIRDQDIVAIYTGKLLPHKKVDLLFFASAPLVKKYKNFKILIVGRGSDEYTEYLKEVVQNLSIKPNVIFHDWVHRTKLPSFYSAADFAVWPAHHSISIIEAMATGLPVLIPESKWTNHLLKYDNGFAYPEGNINELRKYINIMLNDSELREQMGLKSRELVDKELNWEVISKKYLKCYNLVLRRVCREDRLC